MAHWDVARRLRWPEKKLQEVREALHAQQLIELSMPSRGPSKPQYRLQA